MSDEKQEGATPGPWQVIENDGAYVKANAMARYRIETAPGSGRDLCVALVVTDTPELNSMANARLISAAPDMLEALQHAQIALTECANIIRPNLPSLAENVIGTHLREIDAAIAKATIGAAVKKG